MNLIDYKTYTNQLLGEVYKAMDIPCHKRYPRKHKKHMKKAIVNSWGRKAIIQHEAEINQFRASAEPYMRAQIEQWFNEHAKMSFPIS